MNEKKNRNNFIYYYDSPSHSINISSLLFNKDKRSISFFGTPTPKKKRKKKKKKGGGAEDLRS